MRVTYDPEVDAAYVHLTDESLQPGRQSITCELPAGAEGMVVMDWKEGRFVGIEVLNASAVLPADLIARLRTATTNH
jgi:uncharacterized protein YuzE